ncbi:MAG TPA: NADH-quinone oxidoreductase subunit C, partial [Candidatus Angelobacter sp.]
RSMADEPKEPNPPQVPTGEKPAGGASPVSTPAPKPAGAGAPAAPPKPAAPAPPKPPVVLQTPLDNELVKRFRAKFGAALLEALEDRKQAILIVDRARLAEIALHLREEEKFDMLADLTAVDWPKREKRFDVVLNLYSFPKNERLRLKVHAADAEEVPSVVSIWPTANWLEREAFDMFGIIFSGHPDLKRILLPDEWQGYPLRKDYDILQQDTAWVRENLGIESGQ